MDPTPTPKITAVLAAGGFTTILVWLLHETTSVAVPAEVAAAFTTLINFGAGWLKKDASSPNP